MPYLIAAVVLIGAIATINLIFTFAVIRKLREMTRETSRGGLPINAELPEFKATTTTGRVLRRRDPRDGPVLVGVLSTTCDACKTALPEFISNGSTLIDDGGQVLAVVVGDAGDATAFTAQLDDRTLVVVESVGQVDGLAHALDIKAFPFFTRFENGRVTHVGQVALAGQHVDEDHAPAHGTSLLTIR